jgi:Uma2 family endonuclease
MAGTSPGHNRIVFNISHRLSEQLKGGPCRFFGIDLKVRATAEGPYFYPDLVVVCGELQLQDGHPDVIMNPKVVIEILSPSTETFDRGRKFQAYARHQSLTEYVLVAQDRVQIDLYLRRPNGHWDFTSVDDADGFVELSSIGVRLKIADIYGDVQFES